MGDTKHPGAQTRILLGGGIGSGKSVAGRRFEQVGATIVEADRLGHGLLEPGGEAFEPVSELWPSAIVDGRVDRSALAEIVFADREQLSDLEALTHPLIIRRINEIASNEVNLVVETPVILAISGEWTKVYIDADADLRLLRGIERGHTEEDVKRRMESQPTRDEWLAWADHLIHNTGTIEEMERQIDILWYGLRTIEDGSRS